MQAKRVVPIVEGHGEQESVPVVLRRVARWQTPGFYADVLPPIRVHRDRFLNKDDEFGRHLQLAGKKCGDEGFILILLDADDDCPARLGASILARAQEVLPHRAISVVLANREFEAWFIAAAASLTGHGQFKPGTDESMSAESPRDAKGWVRKQMGGRYGEVTDQVRLANLFDLQQAHTGSRSFRKLCAEWLRQTVNIVPEAEGG